MKSKYFCYDPDAGFETFKTAALAQEAAENVFERYRDEAWDGWCNRVDQVCWGEIKQQVTEISRRPVTSADIAEQGYEENITEIVDYQLVGLESESQLSHVEVSVNQPAERVLCSNMKYICDYYSVPAKVGDNVLFKGKKAVIIGAANSYLKLKNEKGEVFLAHPTWMVFYIDDFDRRMESQNKKDKEFLDQHMPNTLDVLAKADALIKEIEDKNEEL